MATVATIITLHVRGGRKVYYSFDGSSVRKKRYNPFIADDPVGKADNLEQAVVLAKLHSKEDVVDIDLAEE